MADIALGIVDKIIKVVAEIKKAVDAAKQNREVVVDIQEQVEAVEDVVSELEETDVTQNPPMDRAMANLHKTLHRALELVKDCEKENILCLLCLLCTAQDLSKKLLRVQEDISRKLLLVNLATTVHITKRLGKANPTRRRRKANPTRRRRRRRPIWRPGPRPQVPSDSWGSDLHCMAFCLPSDVESPIHGAVAHASKDPVPVPSEVDNFDWCKRGDGVLWHMKAVPTLFDDSGMFYMTCEAGSDSDSFEEGESEIKVETGVEDPSVTLSGLKMFSLSELSAATNNFSEDRVIEKGGYSIVYKGVLHDGLVVALKVLRDSHPEDSETRLLDEVKIGEKLKHKNVVKYLGYCVDVTNDLVEKRTHVLVLDYLPNGSLQDIVEGKKLVEWSSCFQIFQEIAQGVRYLHDQRVIHGDLKLDNILFDTSMNPVITDFGVSIILEPHVDEEILDCPVGTLGYMAPETYEFCCLSMKSDVFAFGVCLVKTIIILSTGRRDWYDAAEDWHEKSRKAGGIKGLLLDPTVQVDQSQLMEINRYLEVGWSCIDIDPAKRPTMADVVQMLSGEKEPPTPKNRRTEG